MGAVLELKQAAQYPTTGPAIVKVNDLNVVYGAFHAVGNVSFVVPQHQITALIGPSGCGKSTVLRCINRMNDLVPGARVEGTIEYHGTNINARSIDPVEVRKHIGMVFQKPNPFPKSIAENITWGAKINGYKGNNDELVERCLRQAALWDEVKDKLHESGLALSGGQQQRLCIARTLAINPDVILMDEPCSALDPISTLRIEDLMRELQRHYTIVIVTHNMQQAARVSDQTVFFSLGENRMGILVEAAPTRQLFTNPGEQRTEDYITGRFG
ncbi:MAG: phosphate ABC transporter ATP-binding protein PstB [Thermomicrobiales bacterium]